MGANIVAQGPNETAPIKIHGVKLKGARHELAIASAQVKSALLLAGLFAKGKTTVREPLVSRPGYAWVERMWAEHRSRGAAKPALAAAA